MHAELQGRLPAEPGRRCTVLVFACVKRNRQGGSKFRTVTTGESAQPVFLLTLPSDHRNISLLRHSLSEGMPKNRKVNKSKGRKASKSAHKASKTARKASKSERKSRTGRRERHSSARDREIHQPDFDDAEQDPPLHNAEQDPEVASKQDPPSDSDSDSHHSEGSQNSPSTSQRSHRYNSDFDLDEEDELSETDAAHAENAEDGIKLPKPKRRGRRKKFRQFQ